MPRSPSTLSVGAFRKALEKGELLSVYLLHGDEEFLKDRAIRQLVETVVDAGLRDFNVELRRGSELDGATLASLLGTPPMMAERRLVVIRDVSGLRKDARKALDHYLAHPASDQVLALVAVAGSKPDKTLLDHPGVTRVDCRQLVGDQVTQWIVHHAEAELGGSITPQAADLLQQAVGSDLAQLSAELDKLLSYTSGAEIDESAVSAVVGVRRGETLGDFLDAVASRNARRALELLRHVMQQPKTTGVSIVMALATQTLGMAWAQAARAEGLPQSRLDGELFSLLREGAAYPGRAWGDAVKAWIRHLRYWTPDAFDDALDELLAADLALKESRVSSEEQLLTNLVLALCAPDAARRRSAA